MSSPTPPREIEERIRRGGAVVAHPLALDRDGRPDWRRQAALTRYYLSAGAGGSP